MQLQRPGPYPSYSVPPNRPPADGFATVGLNWVSRSMLFVLHLFQIPTQSVVHGDFARELPSVLRVKPALYAVKPLNVIVPDTCAIQLAKSEARETIAEAGSIKVLALGGRQRRLTGMKP